MLTQVSWHLFYCTNKVCYTKY